MLKRLSRAFLIIAAVTGITASAQTNPAWDNSGNNKLSGTYYFRHVLWVLSDSGDLSDALSLYGNISFDGNGNYIISGSLVDAAQGTITPETIQGTYQISASGYGFIDNPLDSDDEIVGLVTNALTPGQPGIFIGSSTETQDGYNDMFIAAPLASPLPSVSTLNGNYVIVGIDNPSLSSADARDYQVNFTANGAGKFTVSNALGFVAQDGTTAIKQTFGTQSYTSSNGAFALTFSTSALSDSNLITGQHFLYTSPDGNFVFGGSPQGWDMIVGVKQTTGTPNFSGLYYQAGMDLNIVGILEGEDASTPDSYYGSFVPLSSTYLLHQRINNQFNGAYDYTSADPLTINSDGSEDDPYSLQHYVFGANGAIRIGVGNSPFLGIQVAIQAPAISGSGLFVNPTGIQNAANSALFTAGIAPGELISISGSGFPGPASNVGSSLATTWAGAQVLINGIAAPLVYVTPTLISAQVPFEVANATTPVLSIQVVTKSAQSNVVTLLQGPTQPGVYTIPAGGLGTAVAIHISTNQLVTANNPAVPGESLYAYVNGLGTVTPTVADGAPASSTTLSSTDNVIAFDLLDPATFDAYPGSASGTVAFSGLAPTYAGLDQINFSVPTTDSSGNAITTGTYYLELWGFDSSGQFVNAYNSQAQIAVSSGAGAAAPSAAQLAKAHAARGIRPPAGKRKLKSKSQPHRRLIPRVQP